MSQAYEKYAEQIAKRKYAFRMARDRAFVMKPEDRSNPGSSIKKTETLRYQLTLLGIMTCRAFYTFRWTDIPNIKPEIIKDTFSPTTKLEVVQAFIPETKSWIFLDPTWDSKLKGFPIAQWDGVTSTPFAIRPTEVSTLSENRQHALAADSLTAKEWQALGILAKPFTQKFNSWLQSHRQLGSLHA